MVQLKAAVSTPQCMWICCNKATASGRSYAVGITTSPTVIPVILKTHPSFAPARSGDVLENTEASSLRFA